MGTLASITLYAGSPEQAQQAFTAAFRRIRELDVLLSDYNPNSELSRACTTQGPTSADLMKVVGHAQSFARSTDGAFDITAGSITHLWRAARRSKRLPEPREIADALKRAGYKQLRTEPDKRRIVCLTEGMKLDAGGIAKGYAAEEALAAIKVSGVRSALVALSGDIAISDAPPGKSGWRIKVLGRTMLLANAGVSTSGDEFQALQVGTVRYSHIVDPRTGQALRNATTVSVIARTAIEADAAATAVSVGGGETAKILRGARGLRIIIGASSDAAMRGLPAVPGRPFE